MELKPPTQTDEEPMVATIARARHDPVQANIFKFLKRTLDFAKKAYNTRQANPEEQIFDHPIRLYGYEVASANFGMGPKGAVAHYIIKFRIKPMPYAFAGADDRGLSANACEEIAKDLRFAVFKFSPNYELGLFFKLKHTAEDARALIDYVVNDGLETPVDPSAYVFSIEVALVDRLGPTAFVCGLPLADGS